MKPSPLLKTQQLGIQIAHKIVCSQLELEIRPGELWGLLGQNGSGKTTLLHTLGGLKKPAAGEIYLAEQKISRYSAKKRAQRIGLLFQENQAVFPQSVWEYCLAGRYPHLTSFLEKKNDQAFAEEALKTMQLDKKRSQNILTLSGGEWRRLALATLLAQDPELYLLDEPLNHLDLGQKHLLLQYFHKQSRQKKISVLMVLHDINIAEQYCDRIVMLLGEGQTRVGLKKELLTEAQLSILYHHPLHLREDGEKRWWLAE